MTVLERVVREEWGRLTAMLLAQHRRIDLVEDALADAVEAAARTWDRDGTPANPAAWLHTAARRRILDRLRAEAMHLRKIPLLVTDAEHRPPVGAMADPGDVVEDDLLRLVLMCAHPALAPEAASALALRLVVGVGTADIARLFLVPESTMAARLTRAKKKVVAAGIPFAVPDTADLPSRLDTVAQVAYLGFTAGYAPGSGPDLLRADLAGAAISLARVTLSLRPSEPVLVALLALMLLQHSRRDARIDKASQLVLLRDQDRSLWHHSEIAQAIQLVNSPTLQGPMTPQAASYAIQATIAAEHALAPTSAETNWPASVASYDLLLRVGPSPATRLARAVAIAEAEGPEAGLRAMADVTMLGSHRPDAVRAELLARCGDHHAARAAYDVALTLCHNATERAHLEQRRRALGPRTAPEPPE